MPKVKIAISAPVKELSSFTMLAFGKPKLGKTTLACSWPKPVVLATERKGVKAIRVPHIKIYNWENVLSAISLLKTKENRDKYQTVIIDTVDLLYKYCFDWCCEHYGFDHPSDKDWGWGKGWEKITDQFLATIMTIFDLKYKGQEKAVVFTSHTRSTEVEEDWETYTEITPSLAKPGTRVLLPYVDIIGYMYPKKSKKGRSIRHFTTIPAREYIAGDRSGFLSDIDIVLPTSRKSEGYTVLNEVFIGNLQALDNETQLKRKKKGVKIE